MRQRLAKLGFTSPIENLDCITADAFLMIDAEIETLRAEELKRNSRKGR